MNMSRTKKQPEPASQPVTLSGEGNGPGTDVLTLGEAAAYLRLPEQEVLRLVREQDLPARPVGKEWRLFKAAIQEWLSQPLSKTKQEGIWAFAGAWKDDPHAEEMLREIYHRRGRPMTEE
jgi:excisionase family DNA binding protein